MNNGPSTFNNNFKQGKAELDQIKRSKSYRVGKAIMYIPVRLKNLAKRVYLSLIHIFRFLADNAIGSHKLLIYLKKTRVREACLLYTLFCPRG